jgi:large subunit ribosomal protein L10
MALTRAQKATQLHELQEYFSRSSSIIFAHYIGLTVKEITALRRRLREAGAHMRVAKKTLLRIAAKNASLPEIPEEDLTGPVACIFSREDPISGAHIAFAFGKDHSEVSLIGGIFDGKLLSKEQALVFAKMPGKQQLLAIFATMLRSPLQQFAAICSSPLGGFVRALAALSKQKSPTPLPNS